VVEDDSDLRVLYGFVLTRPGYLVDVAKDGAAAGSASGQLLPAPDHRARNAQPDGVELVRKLRAARMALPVVMAARRLPLEELARNPSLQLAATLSKPFPADTLLDTVKDLLRVTDSALSRPAAASLAQPAVSRCFMAAMISIPRQTSYPCLTTSLLIRRCLAGQTARSSSSRPGSSWPQREPSQSNRTNASRRPRPWAGLRRLNTNHCDPDNICASHRGEAAIECICVKSASASC